MNYKWRIKKVVVFNSQNSEKKEFLEKDELILQFTPFGKVEGFINGNYQYTTTGMEIIIHDIKPFGMAYSKDLPSLNNPGFVTPIQIITENTKLWEKTDLTVWFNFSEKKEITKVKPLETLKITNGSTDIYLEEVRN